MNSNLTAMELAVISEIEATSSLLKLVTRLTGMRFSAIAKVTDTTWLACAVHDEVQFGVEPGHQMQIEETICNELRLHRTPVIISEVACDVKYAQHPIPKLFGFQSYFSLPIIFPNGEFFGTLCGLDPVPAKLDDQETLDTLKMFCTLIASTLYAHGQLLNARADLPLPGNLPGNQPLAEQTHAS
ncbi:GAF domain-containing protein [Pseudomonas sp. v388]|uniref:GAF domain-containing protein n=1 Tax=Pseudomonas sp. v388 TaxID=2479849 RepID=UPI000F787BD5|nr:GAF domain-containing protein [Pseudomonas sp. v388]RRV04241.1 GAF domain-containing protein [Pseudomonas sp. v388]